MTKLYHPRKRTVREIPDDAEARLLILQRAGFVVGELPPLPETEETAEEIEVKMDPEGVSAKKRILKKSKKKYPKGTKE